MECYIHGVIVAVSSRHKQFVQSCSKLVARYSRHLVGFKLLIHETLSDVRFSSLKNLVHPTSLNNKKLRACKYKEKSTQEISSCVHIQTEEQSHHAHEQASWLMREKLCDIILQRSRLL